MTSSFPAPGELVFIDRDLPDWQIVAFGVREGVEVILLDAERDGLIQIAEAVQGRSGLGAIHILSHGASGGLGADRFVFDQIPGSGGVDTIRDFSGVLALISHGDLILLAVDRFAALGEAGDDVASEFFALGPAAQDANDHLLYSKATGQLFYDADGVGGTDAILIATLANRADLSAADFTLI